MMNTVSRGVLLLLVMLGTFLPGIAPAGDTSSGLLPQPLSLEKAVAYGLAHNRTFMAAKQDVYASNEKVRQARADFFPKLDTSYTFRQTNDQPFAVFGSSRVFTGSNSLNHWEINISQPLFSGFGLTSRFNISKMDLKISECSLEGARLDIIRDIKHAFLQTLLGEKLLKVARDNVKSLEVQRHNAEAQFQQGLSARNDILKADVALSRAQQQERATAKQLVILKSRLNQLLDLDLHKTIELSEVDIQPRPVPNIEDLYARAERLRPEYLSLEVSIRQAREGITAARSRYYPQVSAFGQYYREGEDFPADTNNFANNHNAAVGLKVDWNWFEGGKTDAAAKESQFRQLALEERRRDLKQQIRIQVQDAYEQLQVAGANLETTQTALKQAGENERMTSLQYQEQLVIFLEVLNAQVFVAQSRADYYQASYGCELARADLERAIGGALSMEEGKN